MIVVGRVQEEGEEKEHFEDEPEEEGQEGVGEDEGPAAHCTAPCGAHHSHRINWVRARLDQIRRYAHHCTSTNGSNPAPQPPRHPHHCLYLSVRAGMPRETSAIPRRGTRTFQTPRVGGLQRQCFHAPIMALLCPLKHRFGCWMHCSWCRWRSAPPPNHQKWH